MYLEKENPLNIPKVFLELSQNPALTFFLFQKV